MIRTVGGLLNCIFDALERHGAEPSAVIPNDKLTEIVLPIGGVQCSIKISHVNAKIEEGWDCVEAGGDPLSPPCWSKGSDEVMHSMAMSYECDQTPLLIDAEVA